MVHYSSVLLFLAALSITGIVAHPGHDVEQEIAERSAYFQGRRRDLSHCATKLKERGIEQRALMRRSTAVHNLRQEVALKSKPACL